MQHRWLIWVGLSLALLVTGCAKPWTVVQQADPNPFIGQKSFEVLPVDYTDLHVGSKTEAEYLGEKVDKAEAKGKDSSTPENFAGDKEAVATHFQEHLRAGAQGDGITINLKTGSEATTYVIKPHIGYMEPGFYAYVAARPSEITLDVTIEDKSGKVLDVIQVRRQAQPSMIDSAAGTRYRKAADALGDIVADYILLRVEGGK